MQLEGSPWKKAEGFLLTCGLTSRADGMGHVVGVLRLVVPVLRFVARILPLELGLLLVGVPLSCKPTLTGCTVVDVWRGRDP